MDKIVQFINSQTNNKYQNLLFFGAIFNKKTSTIQLEFDIKEKELKSQENIEELQLLCEKFLCRYVKNILVLFKKNSLTMNEFKDEVKFILSNNLELTKTDLDNIVFDFNNEIVQIQIFTKFSINNIEMQEKVDEIINEISSKTGQKIQISITEKSIDSISMLDERKSQIIEDNLTFEQMNNNRIVELSNIQSFFGEFESSRAYLAGSLIDEPENTEVAVAGTLKNFDIKETKPKNEEGKRQLSPKKYLSLELEFDGELTSCILFFTKDMIQPDMPSLDSVIAIKGKLNSYGGKSNIRITSMAKCSFIEPKKVFKKSLTNYRFIKPEPYEFTEQIDFFTQEKMTEKEYLLNNTFVVYDLETTGISPEYNKIIDIGAFKIVKGKIVEKFSTFINPECEIPAEASKVNRITNKLVENSPTIEMALPDFHKFCEGSIIVGYNNLGFDDLFIAKESKKLFYKFDNQRDDVFNIAKKHIFGLKNYKLSTVCQAENVPLIDAHRAINDALATAKLFIKLVEKYY